MQPWDEDGAGDGHDHLLKLAMTHGLDGLPTEHQPSNPPSLGAAESWAALDDEPTFADPSASPPLQTFAYDEKVLREAAAAEVARQQVMASQNKEGSQDGRRGVKRKLLSAEEKAKQSRDRNREHARNTRLRKKAYVSKLTQLVEDLTKEKEAFQHEREAEKLKQEQQTNEWRRLLSQFLDLRVRGELDRTKWAAVVDESCVFMLPITPFRSFKRSEILNDLRVVAGIDALVADARSLLMCIESLGANTERWRVAIGRGQRTTARYHIAPDNVVIAEDVLMTSWTWETDNAIICGAECEITTSGMLRCKISPDSGRIVMCELVFDVMGMMHQLQKAAGPAGNLPIVPNTLELAESPSPLPRAIVQAVPSLPIVRVNKAWVELFGYAQVEAEGCSLSVIQGFASDLHAVQKLTREMLQKMPSSVIVPSACKSGEKFRCLMRMFPLSSNPTNAITHFLGVMERLELPPPVFSASFLNLHDHGPITNASSMLL